MGAGLGHTFQQTAFGAIKSAKAAGGQEAKSGLEVSNISYLLT